MMPLTLPCPAPARWWQRQPLGYFENWELWLGTYSVGCFFSSQLCCPLRFHNSPQTHLWEGFLLFGNFSFTTPSPGRVSVPNSFVFYILSYLLLKGMGCNGLPFLVPGVFHQHSEVVLWKLLRIQMIFWWICGRESDPHPILLPSWDCDNLAFKFIRFTWT